MWSFLLRFSAAFVLLAGFTAAFVSPARATLWSSEDKSGLESPWGSSASPGTLQTRGIPLAFAPHLTAAADEPQAEPDRKRHLRRLLKKEVTRAIAREARRIVEEYHREALGTEIEFSSQGQAYVARIEEHYHPPGGEARPWGYHAGASVLVIQTTP